MILGRGEATRGGGRGRGRGRQSGEGRKAAGCPANAGIHFEGGIIPEISELALAAALPHNGIH